jgi:hypothetical protein
MNMFVAGCSGSRACPDSLAARVLQEVLRCVERSDCASSVQDEDLVRTADEIEPATRHEQITAAQPTANEIQYEQSSTQAILPTGSTVYLPSHERRHVPVGDGDDRGVLEILVDHAEQLVCRILIEVGSGLVQHEDLGAPEQCPRRTE